MSDEKDLFLAFDEPAGYRSIVFEEDGRSCYAYLCEDEEIASRLEEFGAHLFERVGTNRINLVDAFRGSRAVPIVAHYIQGLTLKRVEGQPPMSLFATIHVSTFATSPALDDEAKAFLNKLAHAVHWGARGTLDGRAASQ